MQKVAAFDLDGTILDGESPLKLSTNLTRHRTLPLHKALAMTAWGIKYRLRLPLTEETPRELLFSALTEPTVDQVDTQIMHVFNKKIKKHIREDAKRAIARCKEKGYFLILASASFKPITNAIVYELEMDGQVSTIMEEIDGHYTGKVAGKPVQGEHKIEAISQYCDMLFGKGKWELSEAYGDHYSDYMMLNAAKRPVAVDPDAKLERIAKRRGWEIQNWQ